MHFHGCREIHARPFRNPNSTLIIILLVKSRLVSAVSIVSRVGCVVCVDSYFCLAWHSLLGALHVLPPLLGIRVRHPPVNVQIAATLSQQQTSCPPSSLRPLSAPYCTSAQVVVVRTKSISLHRVSCCTAPASIHIGSVRIWQSPKRDRPVAMAQNEPNLGKPQFSAHSVTEPIVSVPRSGTFWTRLPMAAC